MPAPLEPQWEPLYLTYLNDDGTVTTQTVGE